MWHKTHILYKETLKLIVSMYKIWQFCVTYILGYIEKITFNFLIRKCHFYPLWFLESTYVTSW